MAALTDEASSNTKPMDPAALFEDAQETSDANAENSTKNGAMMGMEEGDMMGGDEPEEQDGILAKDALVNPSEEDIDALVERLQVRLIEGRGECIYELGAAVHGDDQGITETELAAAVENLQKIAVRHNAAISHLRTRTLPNTDTNSCAECPNLFVAEYLVRRRLPETDFLEVRVAVVGNVDAGKSTLLGVLTHGALDDGRGFARQKLFRHKHELESGRTSSVGNDILGFDEKGEVVNNPDPHDGHLDWVGICKAATKVFTFIDLAGHERYLKTTIFGMTGHMPDYSMLMVGANAGVIGMTKEHLGLALALSVPVFIVVTKIDMCPAPVLSETLKLLQKILKSPGCRKLPVMVSNMEDVIVSATNFTSERICPIFQVSNVTGHNLELLRTFINLLAVRSAENESAPAEFQIDDTYLVPGVGTVVSGTCLQGVIKKDDTLMLGPDGLGQFIPMPVKSIHRKRMPVSQVRGGQTASFALKKIKRSAIRKGMVMVSPKLNPEACWEFEGEILVLHHPTTISTKYQAMVHCGPIRQTATIVRMSSECLRTGDKAHVKFKFIKNPEYLKPKTRMVFREGRTKAVGNILKILPFNSNQGPQPIRASHQRHNQQQQRRTNHAEAGEDGTNYDGQGSSGMGGKSGSGKKRRGGVQNRAKQRYNKMKETTADAEGGDGEGGGDQIANASSNNNIDNDNSNPTNHQRQSPSTTDQSPPSNPPT